MNNPAPLPSPLRQWPAIATQLAVQSSPQAPLKQSDPEFKQLLTTLLMGFSLQDSSGQGLGVGSLMAPLMLSLLEQLLAGQVEEAEAAETAESAVQAETILEGPSTPRGMPIQGRLTQSSRSGHVALDFGAPVGTPVYATMDGKVVYAGWNDQGYGNLVIVENGPYRTYYAHLSKIPVEVGEVVHARTVIALSGNTGNSTGPHLHYEVRRNNQQLDPSKFVQP